MTNIFESVIKPARSQRSALRNKHSDKPNKFFRAIKLSVIILFFLVCLNYESAKHDGEQHSDNFHFGSLYSSLHHEARRIAESFTLCFESDNHALRVEETQVAFVAVYDSLAKVSLR